MPRKPSGLPPHARWNPSSGKITLLFKVEEDGRTRRLSQNAILKTEPRSYDTAEDARAGYERVRKFLESDVDRHTTLRAFWERWTNEDDWRWGLEMSGRSADSYVVYRSRTRPFMERYERRQIASMTEQDIRNYMAAGGKPSQLPTIALFFNDAIEEGLTTENPAIKLARSANRSATDRRRKTKLKTKPPGKVQIDAMLTRARTGPYPASLYGWLWTGTETGMRGGELDGMRWEFLQGDVYDLQQQLHYRSRTLEEPKHGSFRKVVLPSDLVEFIDTQRGNGSPYIWVNSFAGPWSQDARERWWHWCHDGGASLRQTVGGATMYQATRHHWAWHALNVLKLPVPDIAHLYGHKDGGKTLLEHYADVDGDAARDALRAARAAQPVDLSARRRRSA
jgi:integrase